MQWSHAVCDFLTCLSASLSSLNSFSYSLTASCCFRAAALFVYEVKPPLGLKGFLLSCQFLPAGPRRRKISQEEKGKVGEKSGGLGAYHFCVLIWPHWLRVLELWTTW